MARESQYIPVGNPLDGTLLPLQRPELQFESRDSYSRTARRQTARNIAVLAGTGAVVVAAKSFDLDIDASNDGTFFSLLNVFVVSWAIFFVGRSIRQRTLKWIGLPLVWGAMAYAYFMMPLDIVTQLAINAALMSTLTWSFAHHWSATCTAAPVDIATAADLGNTWTRFLVVAASIPMLVVCTHLLTGTWIIPLMTVTALLLFQVTTVLSNRELSAIAAVRQATVSWFSYNSDDRHIPGIIQSPAGNFVTRIVLTGATLVATAITCVRWPREVFWPSADLDNDLTPIAGAGGQFLSQLLTEPFDSTLAGVYIGIALYGLTYVMPMLITLLLPVALTLPVLAHARCFRGRSVTADEWTEIVEELGDSEDEISQQSLFMGRVESDGSPLLIPVEVFKEHVHLLGDSGSGKTSRGLLPLLEQLIARWNCSVIVIDLKADPGSMELLGTLQAAADWKYELTGQKVPIKHFSNQSGMSTFAFNPLTQPYVLELGHYLETDLLAGALELIYGPGYGTAYFSSSNTALLNYTIKRFPDTSNFRDLAERIGWTSQNAKKHELHPEIRKAGSHVQTVLERLGSFPALNATSNGGYPRDVCEHAIDLVNVFEEQQLHYYYLSSALGPGVSPEIARLVTYSLLAASTKARRNHPVFLVVDEFQRMVSQNVEYMLQQARSMGVSIIMANQSMQDLKTMSANIIPAMEANCRFRQWFSVTQLEDQKRLMSSSGETVDIELGETIADDGLALRRTTSMTEKNSTRFKTNDIKRISDNPRLSVVSISRGAGYAQYRGMPVIAESEFHISQSEYERRRKTPWPTDLPGTFVPDDYPPDETLQGTSNTGAPPSRGRSGGASITTEVIGSHSSETDEQWDNPLDAFVDPEPNAKKRKRQTRRKKP